MPIQYIKEPSVPWASAGGREQKRIDEKKLEGACMDFESLFLLQMLKSMRQTIPKTGIFAEGPGRDIFESLFDQELSKRLAQKGTLGLGKMIYKKMLPAEEKRPLSYFELEKPTQQKVILDQKGKRE